MVYAWEEDTCGVYSTGLLMWHCFCDDKEVPEPERAPASQALLSAFVAHMAMAYSGKTISSYLYRVQAWHILHSIPWRLEKEEMDTMLQAANKLTPNSSRRKKRCPYTPDFITVLKQHLDPENPLDAAISPALPPVFTPRLGSASLQYIPWIVSTPTRMSLSATSPMTRIAMASK